MGFMPCSVYVCNIYGNEAHSVGGRRRWTGFLVVSPMIGEMHASGREVSLVPQWYFAETALSQKT